MKAAPDAQAAPMLMGNKQVKNFAVSIKEAITQLGCATREVSRSIPKGPHNEKVAQLLESLERLYWISDGLERAAHHELCQQEHTKESKHVSG